MEIERIPRQSHLKCHCFVSSASNFLWGMSKTTTANKYLGGETNFSNEKCYFFSRGDEEIWGKCKVFVHHSRLKSLQQQIYLKQKIATNKCRNSDNFGSNFFSEKTLFLQIEFCPSHPCVCSAPLHPSCEQ